MADRSRRCGDAGGIRPSRIVRVRTAVLAIAVSMTMVACGGSGSGTTVTAGPTSTSGSVVAAGSSGAAGVAPTTSVASAAPAATSPLAAAIVAAGSTLYDPRAHQRGALPATVTVRSIGVKESPIIPVGVDANGAFAVPGAREVGWYEFGPRPGETGSSVLAAHIAFDGVDGVFRRLASTKVGDEVAVTFADGTSAAFTVETVERIDKDELPAELFATTGPPQLVLISCGGAFDRDRQSYEDNIVVIARPTAQAR